MNLFLRKPRKSLTRILHDGWRHATVPVKPLLVGSLAILSVLAGLAVDAGAQSLRLSDAQAARIGERIWRNESGGTVAGLTAWNYGEDFASLGIAHFIWYPEGRRGPFEESFPLLLSNFQAAGVRLPGWLVNSRSCPWPDRSHFLADQRGARMEELRSLLANTVALQAKFAVSRLEAALPKMLEAAEPSQREKIRRNFYRVAAEPSGPYALVDYVNFKGEGTLASERYKGLGWGLLQVLEAMDDGPALLEFRHAADVILKRRVENSPPERGESRWLRGWKNRTGTYTD